MESKNFKAILIILSILVIISIVINLNIGFIKLGFEDFFYQNSENSQIASLRINRVLAMLLAGISIPTSGFLLQEYFQNPLAGPFRFRYYFCSEFVCSFLYIFFTRFCVTRIFTKWFHQYFRNSRKSFDDECFTRFF